MFWAWKHTSIAILDTHWMTGLWRSRSWVGWGGVSGRLTHHIWWRRGSHWSWLDDGKMSIGGCFFSHFSCFFVDCCLLSIGYSRVPFFWNLGESPRVSPKKKSDGFLGFPVSLICWGPEPCGVKSSHEWIGWNLDQLQITDWSAG